MLRTRLYLGLLPLLLLMVATGGYAIYFCRDLAGSFSRDLINNYRAVIACQHMRETVGRMQQTLLNAPLGESDRKAYEADRSAFLGELLTQMTTSVDAPRLKLVDALKSDFDRFSAHGDELVRSGGSRSIGERVETGSGGARVVAALDDLIHGDFIAAQKTVAFAGFNGKCTA